jgi:hypothetical protein
MLEVGREAEDERSDWSQFLELAPRQGARKLLHKVAEHEGQVMVQQIIAGALGKKLERLSGHYSLVQQIITVRLGCSSVLECRLACGRPWVQSPPQKERKKDWGEERE